MEENLLTPSVEMEKHLKDATEILERYKEEDAVSGKIANSFLEMQA